MAKSIGKAEWHAAYWNKDTHGSAWSKVRDSLKRDWSQTKSDLHVGNGHDLKQNISDTVKQATGGEPIPPPNQPNLPDFELVEPAISYGFAAHEEYGQKYQTWSDTLETQLSKEWDPKATGMTFDAAKPNVRRGWDYRK